MTVTLDAPSTLLVPTPRLSEEDALLAWVSALGHGVRYHALALSDMPKSREARKAAMGWESVKGIGVLPNRNAALLLARWAKQGVERHPGGELGLWRACFISRWTHRTDQMDAPTYRKLCKPFGGARRIDAAIAESSSFSALHPESKQVDHTPKPLRLMAPATVCESDSYGPEYCPASQVTRLEPLDDLTCLADSIDGLDLLFWQGAYELRLHGELVTLRQYRNFHRFL